MTDPEHKGPRPETEPSPGAAEPAPAAGDDAGARVAEAENMAQELRDQCLRMAAELENVRRRASRDVENAHRYGIERFAKELLAVADSMDMGIDAARQSENAEAVVEGFEATQRLLQSVFEKFGITRMEAAGKRFDPEWHEAISVQPSPDAEPDTVLAVVQTGYRIHDRPLRPARVIVAKAPE
ncbi:MAG: nucleotide exchange factor GrpE [Gammaproteobacteria bacterium]